MRYICSWSGGKDSTATIILCHLLGIPLDTIIFCEVMYDNRRKISGENPKHIEFVKKVAKPLFESWGYEVLILHSDRDYLGSFNQIIEKPRIYMEHKGLKHGFFLTGMCAIQRDCKLRPIMKYLSEINEPYTQYLGYCVDEPKRLRRLEKLSNVVSILAQQGYTELDATCLCREYGLLSPIYTDGNTENGVFTGNATKRSGCWFCPNAKLEEHRQLRRENPDLWQEFVALEQEEGIAYSTWSIYGGTLAERENILAAEMEAGL